MINPLLRQLYYAILSPMMRANALRYRFRGGEFNCVQLGPGQNNYINGWTNVDANIITAKCDIWADCRFKLPFRENSVDAFYSHHVTEHLPNLDEHFANVFHCLAPSGVYRIGVPNGDNAIVKFLETDHTWFSDFPVSRKSIGGRLDNFILCAGEHLALITQSFLEELLTDAGFENITNHIPGESSSDRFSLCLEKEKSAESDFIYPHTLLLEAHKSL
jgi:predicted SAM-dependent methyltransferase